MADINANLSIPDVKKIAVLANIPLTDEEARKLAGELTQTLHFIEKIKKIDTKDIKPTSHVTGLSNVYRDDQISPSLTQKEALSQAKSTYKGYFKVPAVLKD
ncbi:hypothetical protein A3D77_04760 [Candidatus Gottesmanbacteria bacterium RIFCSPHIGHO2_02_FULL_39_11]|uniref:Aspartyl/glutamyl-tRNA(Asn/Gln) amidotransferase subunit C n=1 Tax=Candidatus Gottesmanbacteria bacterium RIFCSPHIGHO2_02_FULL_39_11 TaxID=1798382 RepID=A0A1F5ZUF3_9BACT|nr:MAG: hypothetical protein A3D77_04760 [Candidatus Gottesmanbacteria bacterium RIFCSPHIGHO2_02_FULL_39_11]